MKALKLFIYFALQLLGFGAFVNSEVSANDVVPSFTISKAHEAIQPTDLAWEIQPPVFLKRLEAEEPTAQFKIRSDEHGLFVQIRQFQSDGQERVQTLELRIALDPNQPQNAFRFVWDRSSHAVKQFRQLDGQPEKAVPIKWLHTFRQEKYSECYCVEIPFASLGVGTPHHGDVWGFNVKVISKNSKGKSISSAWVALSLDTENSGNHTLANQAVGTIAFE